MDMADEAPAGPLAEGHRDKIDPAARTAVAAGVLPIRWTDCSCHLPPLHDGERLEKALDEAVGSKVMRLVNVGTNIETSTLAAQVAASEPGIWSTAGIHPQHLADAYDIRGQLDLGAIELLLFAVDVVAVGVCGLDYRHSFPSRRKQLDVFAAHIALANAYDRLLVVHTRQAWSDTFEVLDREGVPGRVVLSPFVGGVDEARVAVEMGIHLSFNLLMTLPAGDELRQVAANCPPELVVLETTGNRSNAAGSRTGRIIASATRYRSSSRRCHQQANCPDRPEHLVKRARPVPTSLEPAVHFYRHELFKKNAKRGSSGPMYPRTRS